MWKTLGGGLGVKEKKRAVCLLLSRVLKSPFVSCSKMAAVGKKKRMFVVIWFTSPCSSVFTAQRLIDGGNIWLLCIAQRVHIYYTWHSVHLPETQPACSSISANTRTRDKHILSLLLVSSQATPMPDRILFLRYQMKFLLLCVHANYGSLQLDADKWAKRYFVIISTLKKNLVGWIPDSHGSASESSRSRARQTPDLWGLS